MIFIIHFEIKKNNNNKVQVKLNIFTWQQIKTVAIKIQKIAKDIYSYNRCLQLLCIMSIRIETIQNSKDDPFFLKETQYVLVLVIRLLWPEQRHDWSSAQKREIHWVYSVPRWSLRKFRPNSENEACHEKDDTETDTDDATIAAGGRLGGHSPLPERDRSVSTRWIILLLNQNPNLIFIFWR